MRGSWCHWIENMAHSIETGPVDLETVSKWRTPSAWAMHKIAFAKKPLFFGMSGYYREVHGISSIASYDPIHVQCLCKRLWLPEMFLGDEFCAKMAVFPVTTQNSLGPPLWVLGPKARKTKLKVVRQAFITTIYIWSVINWGMGAMFDDEALGNYIINPKI